MPHSSPSPDPQYAWMVLILGVVIVLGGAGLAALSLVMGDGRAVLWIALGTVGVVGIGFGLRALVRIRMTRR